MALRPPSTVGEGRPRDRVALTLPNLIVPGAGKSGTSSLHDYLDQHPGIFMSQPKEPHFFSNDRFYRKGLPAYGRLFAAGATQAVRGESSTTYMHFPNVVERIRRDLPSPSFIFVLRNPIDRVASHYSWLRRLGLERRPLREAFMADHDEVPDFRNSRSGMFYYYADETRYARHLRTYIDAFGSTRVLVVTTEALREDPETTLAQCASFLSLEPFPHLQPVWANATADQEPVASSLLDRMRPKARREKGVEPSSEAALTAADREWLRDMFAPEVAALRTLLAARLSEWEADFPFDQRA
jgi:hypothetical protein